MITKNINFVQEGVLRILHIGLLSHFTEGMTYQDNMLTDIHCLDGNEVLYVSDNRIFVNGKLVEVPEEKLTLNNSLQLIRVKYDKVINSFVSKKIQKVTSLKNIIYTFKPDKILYHGVCGSELITVAGYKKNHPDIKLYVDCHADFHNTAKTLISKIAYKYIHGYFIKQALPYIDKIFYVTPESKEYLQKMYKIDENLMEWFPLGGIVFDDENYHQKRSIKRAELGLKKGDILFIHSGKMDISKKTIDILIAFSKVKSPNFRLAIIGAFQESIWEIAKTYINSDKRIVFLGWKNADELLSYLCAADIYIQPGTQSATMQNALCCRCGVLVYPYPSYISLIKENGFFIKNSQDIENVLRQIQKTPKIIGVMKKKSEFMSKKFLDYKIIAKRIYL